LVGEFRKKLNFFVETVHVVRNGPIGAIGCQTYQKNSNPHPVLAPANEFYLVPLDKLLTVSHFIQFLLKKFAIVVKSSLNSVFTQHEMLVVK
jgi:hypothetical protein